ncbi:MAG: 2-succinyl-5-enolpyruvyl-6-hydroxy-3-cyclohexene-1-carboxylic-acid synthase, partial [Deltaproteobacteria bacterium]|nr:2-succinyl-5-enolpyruvyl-6-hydroxy-3-cyclohexene-1-carboxylic-acid synthase [Deltaproteobacteria bacterium]
MAQQSQRNYAIAGSLVDELFRLGLRHACLSPGSRSTPLVLSLARHEGIKTWVHLDERSAAFFALGLARALSRPVAIACTSGTAAANFFPAVVEAYHARVPLLVLTADRPAEVWGWGANQTIDQTRIYGSHAKWSVNLLPPDDLGDLLRYVRATSCRALATAVQDPAGPVHINIPFREPLVPEEAAGGSEPATSSEDGEALIGRPARKAYLEAVQGTKRLGGEELRSVAGSLRGMRRGLIVCGAQEDPRFPAAVSDLAARLGYPVLADPLSQVRCGAHERGLVIDCYDAFLRSDALCRALAPEVILRFGQVPTSQAALNFFRQHARARQILIDDGGWPDPIHVASEILCADARSVAEDLAGVAEPEPDPQWANRWRTTSELAREAITAELENMGEFFEGKIFRELAFLLPEEAALFAGNSMPVRDMDGFFPSIAKQIRFAGNRGASGIDGVLSTALGFGAALAVPLVLVVGDISFYHDMNGLFAARKHGPAATIILVNNDGGGIFSFLPQRRYPEYFETYFGTPHGL